MRASGTGNGRPLILSFGTSLLIQALNVLTGVMLARSLGPHGRGELAAVMLWPGLLAALGSLGVVEAITYYAARSTASVGSLLASSLALCVLQSIVLVGAGMVIVSLALGHFGPATLRSARLFLAYIPLYLFAMYLMAVLNGTRRYARFHALRFLVIGVSAAGLIALALVERLTVELAALVYLVAHLAALVATGLCIRVERTTLRVERKIIRQLLAFGVRSHSGNLASMLNERLDQLLISLFLAPASLGLYVIAVTMTSVTGLVGSSAALVALPSVAQLAPGPRRDETARRMIAVTLLVSAAVTVPILLLLPQLIVAFFGRPYLAAAPSARILLLAAVILSTNHVMSAVLRAAGRPLDAGWAELLALLVTGLGLAAMLPAFGLVGAAITSLLAYTVSMGWMTHRAKEALGASTRTLLLPDRDILSIAAGGGRLMNSLRRIGEGPR
jgi:O-antigen/teichoic acid export membrane protein